jgi:protease I
LKENDMSKLNGKRIAILATHGFEQSELTTPKKTLTEHGAEVVVIAPEAGEIRGWDGDDWGDSTPVDMTLDQAQESDFHALVLPGGQINPDILRVNDDALAFIRAFHDAKKPLAAICHAPWLLVQIGAAKGRAMTSFKSIRTDVENAGAEWRDEAVVCDQAVITSRNPGDLEAFCDKIVEEVLEGRHEQRRVA